MSGSPYGGTRARTGPVGDLPAEGPLRGGAEDSPGTGTAGRCGRRPGWLWPGYHCTLDKELRRDYGFGCAAYWLLFDAQGGRCAVCGHRPGPRRLVVDEDPDTGAVRGLLHSPCNRRVTAPVSRYLADPPGSELGLVVPGDRRRRRQRRLDAKRAARRRSATTTAAAPEPDTYAGKVAAALRSSTPPGGHHHG